MTGNRFKLNTNTCKEKTATTPLENCLARTIQPLYVNIERLLHWNKSVNKRQTSVHAEVSTQLKANAHLVRGPLSFRGAPGGSAGGAEPKQAANKQPTNSTPPSSQPHARGVLQLVPRRSRPPITHVAPNPHFAGTFQTDTRGFYAGALVHFVSHENTAKSA